MHYGLFDKKTIEDQKNSNTFSSEGFARETLSVWTGTSEDSWFNQNKLLRSRRLLKCERKATYSPNENAFYVLSCDVARTGLNDTSIMIIKVLPKETGWIKRVVYTENLSKMSMILQAQRIKQLNELYRPREIVVDGNGVGRGLIDELIVPSRGPKGEFYPPLYVFNDTETYPYPRDQKENAIVYCMIANAQINNDVYSNLYVQFNSGKVELLADERIVREKLMTLKKGQKMNSYQREKFLLPYTMTSRLIDEMSNLRLKLTGAGNQVTVEQIAKRINKDRVSALGYGLYRIKEIEDKATRHHRSSKGIAAVSLFSSSKRKKG